MIARGKIDVVCVCVCVCVCVFACLRERTQRGWSRTNEHVGNLVM